MSVNKVSSIFLTLILGFIGGVVLYFLTMPLPWILGSLILIAGLSLWGHLKLVIPINFRQAMLAVLGVLLGSGFHASEQSTYSVWIVSLCAVVVLVLTQLLFSQVLLKLMMRSHNFATRYFGGTAGGLLEMSIMARERGGDDRAVMVLHTMRVLLIVILVPLYFRIFEGYTGSSMTQSTGGLLDLNLIDASLLIAAALFGYYGGKWVKLPAHALTGPLIVSAIFHAAGWTSAQPPFVLVVFAQIVVGCSLGTRFSGYSMRRIKKLFIPSTAMAILLIGLAILFAWGIWHLTGLPFYGLLLAFVPGGMIEMCLIALALNIDVGFVTTHALFRAFTVFTFAPILYPIFMKVRTKTHGK